MSKPATILRALFETEEAFIKAAEFAAGEGCRHLEGYSPKPVEELDRIWRAKPSRIPKIAFWGGLSGAVLAYAGQQYTMAVNYPHNVGGRPLYSWPLFLPITFEMMVLGASLTALLALLIILRLPKLYQPYLDSSFGARSSDNAYVLELGIPEEEQANSAHPAEVSAWEASLKKLGAVSIETVKGEEVRS